MKQSLSYVKNKEEDEKKGHQVVHSNSDGDLIHDGHNNNNKTNDETDVMSSDRKDGIHISLNQQIINNHTRNHRTNNSNHHHNGNKSDNPLFRFPSPPPHTSAIIYPPPIQQPRYHDSDNNNSKDKEKKEEEQIQQHVYPSIPKSTFSSFQPLPSQSSSSSSSFSVPITTTILPKPLNKTKSLDQFFHKTNINRQQYQQIKYYRIIYKGFVALLNEPNLYSKKNGIYVSYGEIVTTRNVISKDISLLLKHQKQQQLSPLSLFQPHPLSNTGSSDDHDHCDNDDIVVSSSQYYKPLSTLPSSNTTTSSTDNNTIHSSSTASALSNATNTTVSSSSVCGGSGDGGTIQSNHYLKHNTSNNNSSSDDISTSTTTLVNIIQIETILTGGYANDSLNKGTSHTHHTPRRSNANKYNSNIIGSSSSSIGGGSESHLNNVYEYNPLMSIASYDHKSSLTTTNNDHHNGYGILYNKKSFDTQEDKIYSHDNNYNDNSDDNSYGYLLQSRNGIPIAEEIPHPPLLCQNGTFFYRVISTTPLPILAGPSIDAPITRAVALPGTVHEISLRMGSVHGAINGGSTATTSSSNSMDNNDIHVGNSSNHNSYNCATALGNSSFEDGIVYLRLSHRRGWIADRRYVLLPMEDNYPTSPRHRSPNRTSPRNHRRNESIAGSVIHSNINRRKCIEFVMKEVSDYVDVSNFEISDEVSLGGTSISSASVSTPANILRSRRRSIRRHNDRDRRRVNDSRSGMVVMPKAKKKGYAIVEIGNQNEESMDNLLSPTSDVSLLSNQSNNKDQIIQTHQTQNLSTTEKDQIKTSNSIDKMTTEKSPDTSAALKPSIFLFRVTAPNGLKILDAPHFQVSSLIRGQGGTSTMPVMKTFKNTSTDLTISHSINSSSSSSAGGSGNPSVIFHTMNSSSQTDYGRTCSWELDASGKKRLLPRGVLFEACSKIERSGNFAHGAGLIKLADGTGWAIIPNKHELKEQYSSIQNGTKSNTDSLESSRGFEEVGNACCADMKDNKQQPVVDSGCDTAATSWVRIVQETGVIVSCAPPSSTINIQKIRHPSPITTSYSSESLCKGLESDTASTVSSVFGAFRSSKRNDRRLDSLSVVSANIGSRKRMNKRVNVIPCGTCVQVDTWVVSKSHPERQSFVRLCGGQGWIPRIFQGSQYAVDIRQPDLRQGSFWFRVQTVDGMIVRVAPSSRSRPIKSSSDGTSFRFECGEYLRASEIITIHGHADVDHVTDGQMISNPSESFAKLYRHKKKDDNHHQQQHPNNDSKFLTLSCYTTPGEWVHVHCNGNLYLEECVNPPTIKRDQNGWEYEVINKSGIPIHKGPSFASDCHTVSKLQYGAIVLIHEQVTPTTTSTVKTSESLSEVKKNHDFGQEDHLVTTLLSWYRLKDGRGFISSHDANGIMNIIEKKNVIRDGAGGDIVVKKDPSSYKLIARLFQTDLSSSTV